MPHLEHFVDLLHRLHLHFEHARTSFSASAEASAAATAATGEASSSGLDKELQALSGGALRVDLLNNNNSQYYGDFTLGSPPQRFTAVFDTGSGITWVPGSSCTSTTCAEHHRFDPTSSGSEPSTPVATAAVGGSSGSGSGSDVASSGSIHYGTGEVKYQSGSDVLGFCDSHDNAGCHVANGRRLEVAQQPFGQSTQQTDNPFRILPFDGILGLAPSAMPTSVLHQLKVAKALPKNVLGVYLSEDTHRSGSIDFGGVEPAHIAQNSPLHWHKIRTPKEWQLSMKDVLVDGKPLHLCDQRPGGVCPAVMDTGSSLITGPTGEVEKLLDKIHTDGDCSNLAHMPSVSIQLVDKDGQVVSYPLTPAEYTLRSLEEVPNTGDSGFFNEFPVLGQGGKAPTLRPHCEPGMGVMDVPGKKWVLGDTLLRRYYSIYDDDRGLVGMVRSVHPDEAAVPAKAPVLPPSVEQAAAPAVAAAWMSPPRGIHVHARYCRSAGPARRADWARFL
eukprot:gnl/TRDRNA2_/TRDRNA2_193994_c0_seq1.p1 gnl/TRDRNA2_/TRDRNA2_193994_c0~~gnl/TRDRNA2_/TRDRNA2_193994_c0_seq1.p1  ORF type:complete len:501 (+),score=93.87 gnl/TRDRNA2_/TRDRNA2_193994_c0_seq1:95-1597(+)